MSTRSITAQDVWYSSYFTSLWWDCKFWQCQIHFLLLQNPFWSHQIFLIRKLALLYLECYLDYRFIFFFLTLQKWRERKGRSTSRGEEATFQILGKVLRTWRRRLFLWIWRQGLTHNFQLKHCPWFHPSVTWKLFLCPGSPAVWLVCFRKSFFGVVFLNLFLFCQKNQSSIKHPVRRGPLTFLTPHVFSTESRNRTYWPLRQTEGSRSPSQGICSPKDRQPLRSIGLGCFNTYSEVHRNIK